MAEKQYVVFSLGTEEYGLEIQAIQEIIRVPKITKMPNTPAYVLGITNLRGHIIPIIDLRQRFMMEHLDFGEETRIIILKWEGQTQGLVVDKVCEVVRISDDDIEKAAAMHTEIDADSISGVARLAERLVILLRTDFAA